MNLDRSAISAGPGDIKMGEVNYGDDAKGKS